MLKVENNLGDLTAPPPPSLPLNSLIISSFFSFLFHPPPFHPAPFTLLLHPPLLSPSLPPEWPDAGNFTTVDVFTFLYSWERMNIYDAGLSLWGICLYSQLICVRVLVWYWTTDSSASELRFLSSSLWGHDGVREYGERPDEKKKGNQYFMRAKTSRHTHFIFSFPEHCL